MEQQETKVTKFSRLIVLITSFCPLVFLLLSLWTIGCAPEIQVPIPEIELTLDIADSSSVLEIVDVSDPTKPLKVSSTSLPSKPEYYSSISVWRKFALATTAYGVHFLDVANPSAPKLLWNLPLDTISGKTVIFKDYAFFPTQKGLYVLHLKNPLDPQWVFHAGHKGNLHTHLFDLKIKGNYAYAHGRHNYLHVFNLSQPEQPYLVNSYDVGLRPPVLLFRAKGEGVELIHQLAKNNLDSLANSVRFFRRFSDSPQGELPPDLANQLADWSDLLELSASWAVKVHMSPQYISWVHLHQDDPQLCFLPSKESRIYSMDVALAYTKYLYTSGKHPETEEITHVIEGQANEDTLYLVSQDNWMKTVEINRGKESRVADFLLAGNLVYILRKDGTLFVAELSTTEDLKGIGLLENLSQPSQCLTLDGNFLYILGSKSSCVVQSR